MGPNQVLNPETKRYSTTPLLLRPPSLLYGSWLQGGAAQSLSDHGPDREEVAQSPLCPTWGQSKDHPLWKMSCALCNTLSATSLTLLRGVGCANVYIPHFMRLLGLTLPGTNQQ